MSIKKAILYTFIVSMATSAGLIAKGYGKETAPGHRPWEKRPHTKEGREEWKKEMKEKKEQWKKDKEDFKKWREEKKNHSKEGG